MNKVLGGFAIYSFLTIYILVLLLDRGREEKVWLIPLVAGLHILVFLTCLLLGYFNFLII